jgi:hypothetical protein
VEEFNGLSLSVFIRSGTQTKKQVECGLTHISEPKTQRTTLTPNFKGMKSFNDLKQSAYLVGVHIDGLDKGSEDAVVKVCHT